MKMIYYDIVMNTELEVLHATENEANRSFERLSPLLLNAARTLNPRIGRDPAESLFYVFKILRSEGIPLTPDYFPSGAAAIAETARMIQLVNLRMPDNQPITFESEQRVVDWSEGMYKISMSWRKKEWERPARLFQFGITSDSAGRLVFKNIQKHLLGLNYRKNANPSEPETLKEKRHADSVMKHIEERTKEFPELYGFLCVSMLFGPYAANGEILFPTPEYQPAVAVRQNRIALLDIEQMTFRDNKDDELMRQIEKIQHDIEMIQSRTDFARMLAALHIPVSQANREGYLITTLQDIRQGLDTFWPQDTGPDVYPLRKILQSIVSNQRATGLG